MNRKYYDTDKCISEYKSEAVNDNKRKIFEKNKRVLPQRLNQSDYRYQKMWEICIINADYG